MKLRVMKYIMFSLLMILFCKPIVAAEWDINIDASSPFLDSKYSKTISMDFQEAKLVDVLKIFSQQSDLNLVTSADIANKKVTVYLEKVPIEQALEQVLRANNLTYELQPNSDIYIVKEIEKTGIQLSTRVYPLKHATVSGAKIKYTYKIKSGEDDETDGTESKGDSTGILGAILAVLSKDDSGEILGSVVEDARTNSLIITDLPNNFARIEATLARLDIPVAQILIEVEMLEVDKETSDKIGIKIGDQPLTFTGGQRDHVYPWNQNRLLDKGYAFEDPEYRVGTIDASGLKAVLNFLHSQTDTKNLARPRILTLNNEPAQIKIATDEAIGIKTQTSSSQTLALSSEEAERVETGVILTVTPQANIFSGEITLAIVPKVIVARTGATFAGTTFRDPEERGAKTTLRVQSGDTVIIGGLMREDTSKTVTKVPILGDIPFVGSAFRHKNMSVSERELIIFITPHLINETPVPATAVTARKILREQDAPFDNEILSKEETSKTK